ncbi:MAG: (2Fe-2S)-binding protein [Acidobacteria bacterium]|nr:(2Fe-2S)-binding protein [Acidobacteriota bacterium]
MKDVIIKFESEGLEGVVAVGSYLSDAAKRLGIKIEGDCLDPETEHECAMKVSAGKTLLSPPTQTELEQLSSQARRSGERLACQTIIEKPGEVTVMTVKKKQEEPKVEDKSEDFKKEFEEMPLDEKIASLLELEAIALEETFSYVMNSPYKAVGKVMDVMADFGFKMDKADQEAKRPAEHAKDKAGAEKDEAEKADSRAKPKTASKRSTSKKTTAGKSKSASNSSTKKQESEAEAGGNTE